MLQRTFQMPLYNQAGVPAAEEINRWLQHNPCCKIAELHTAQCGAPLLFGIMMVMDDFDGLLPGEDDYYDDGDEAFDGSDCANCPDRCDCEAFDDDQDCDDINVPAGRAVGNHDQPTQKPDPPPSHSLD